MTHDDFHLQMNAYLAGGLTDAERAALAAHAASCPACAAALEQAEAADRELDELFAAARPDGGLEDRVIGRLRAVRSRPPMTLHPMVRRAAVGVAATILLGGVGFAVTQAERENGSSLFSFLDPAAREAVPVRVRGASNLRQLGDAIRDNRASHAAFIDDLSDVATPAEMADRFARGITVTPESAATAAPTDIARRLTDEVGVPAAGDGSAGTGGENGRVRRAQQETAYRFDSAIASAERRIARGRAEDFGAARVALDQARLARASNTTVIPPGQLSAWDDRVRETELTLAEAERRAADGESEQAALGIKASIARQERDSIRARESTLDDLVRTSRRLSAEGRYGEALGVVDQIAVLDPDNEYAKGARPLVEQRARQSGRLPDEMTDSLDRAADGSTPALPQPPNVGAMFRRDVHGREAVVMNDPEFKEDEKRPAARAAVQKAVGEVRLMREVDQKETAGRAAAAGGASYGMEAAGEKTVRGKLRSESEPAAAAGETVTEGVDARTGILPLYKKNVEAGAMLATRLYAQPPNTNFGDTVVAGKELQERFSYQVDAPGVPADGTAPPAGPYVDRFRPADAVPTYVDGHVDRFDKRLGDDTANNPWYARFGNAPAMGQTAAGVPGAGGHPQSGTEAEVRGETVAQSKDKNEREKSRSKAGDAGAPAEVERLSDSKAEPADAKKAGASETSLDAGATEGKPVAEKAAKNPAASSDFAYQEAEGERPLERKLTAAIEPPVAQADPANPATDAAPEAPAQQPAATDAAKAQVQQAAKEARQARLVAQADRKIIRNGDMSFEVDGYDSAVVQINKIAAEEGGFVATTESEKLPNGKVKGSVIVRVPPDRLDTLVLKLRGLGDLKNSRISAQDVTKQFTDLAAQLKAAQTMEKRLLQIIDSGKGEVKDLIEAEKQLGTWRERIETLTGEINYYNNLVSLSTLTVSLMERDIRQSALLSESEQVNMGIEATDVEQARGEAIKAIADAKGRIVESDLKTHDAGQYAATITAEVAPEAAGPVIDRLKQIGRVSRLEVQRRLATAEGAPPAPGARLERKDTRLQLSIYNLANVAPRNTTTLNLAAEDVEKAYRAILEQVGASGGRVVNSQLTKPTPEQTTGTVVFEAPADVADVLLGAVRGAGEVMRLDSTTNPDTQNSTDAKRGFSVQIQSLATVPPRESTTLRVAARDVAAAFNALREAVRSAGGRILTSQLAEQEGGSANVTGQLDFEVRRADYAAVEAALGTAGAVLSRNVSRSSDAQNTVDSKVLLQVALVDERTVPPRETVTLSLAVDDVAVKYEALLNALREVGGGGARVLVSSINQQDPNNPTATVEFDVRREDRAAVDKALADAGAVYGRTVARPAEGQPALDEKLRLSVTLNDVDNLAPRETTTLGLEVPADVYATVNSIEAQAIALGGRKVDSDWAQDAGGRNVARVVVDVPLDKAPELLDRAQRAGRVLTVQREQNPSAPEGTFSRARLSVTVATTDPILQRDQGLAASIKSGLSTSVYWLLESVKLIVIGLCLVAPWAFFVWFVLWLVRRARERRRRGGITGPTPPGGGAAATPAT